MSWTPPPVGSPCWFEIPAVDVVASKKFYSSLFPTWEWRPSTDKYPDEKIAMFTFSKGAETFGGGITRISPEDVKTRGSQGPAIGVTLYHYVVSIDETREKAVTLGAKVLGNKEPEGDFGFYQLFEDVAGNRFGIYEFKTS